MEHEDQVNENTSNSVQNDQLVSNNQPEQSNNSVVVKKNKRKRNTILALVFVLIGFSVLAYLLIYENNSETPVSESNKSNVAPKSSKTFKTQSIASGTLNFEEEGYETVSPKFVTLTYTEELKNKFIEQGVEDIVFDAGFLIFEGSQLYHLDVKNEKSIKIYDEASSPSIMSDSYVLVNKVDYKEDGYITSIIALDLNNKEDIYVDGGRAYEFVSQANAVSPDGLKIALVKEGKVDIWDLNSRAVTKTCALDITPFSENFPRSPEFYKLAPYHSERHYPAPVWMQDNESLVLADRGYVVNIPDDPINVESYRNTNIITLNTNSCETKNNASAEGAKEQIKVHPTKADAITYFQNNYWNQISGNFVTNYILREENPKLLDQITDYQIVDYRMDTIISHSTIGLEVKSYSVDGEYLGVLNFTTDNMKNKLTDSSSQILDIGFVSEDLYMYRITDNQSDKEFIAVFDTKNNTAYDFAEIDNKNR